MPVDPQLQVMLDQAAARAAAAGLTAGPGPLPPEVLRPGYRAAILAALGADYAPVPLAEVRDTQAAGVPVTYLDGKGLVHGFLYYPRVARACATARDAFADAIRSAVAQGAPGAQKGRQHVG